MSAVQTKERTFDPLGLYDEILFMPGDVDGFDRKGNPLNVKGKVLAVRESVRYRLQNGEIFDAAGQLVEDPPKRVREQAEKMRAEHPRPGITHAARMRNGRGWRVAQDRKGRCSAWATSPIPPR